MAPGNAVQDPIARDLNLTRTAPQMPSATDELQHVHDWVDPEEWYGVTDPWTGQLWHVLTRDWREAKRIADNLGGGTVVVVTTRIGADAEGDYVEPTIHSN